MSLINDKPFVKELIQDLSAGELATLCALVDGGGNQTALLRTVEIPSGSRTNITVADKGVHVCSLQVGNTLFKGYLIYSDNYCALIHFTDSQVLGVFRFDTSNFRKFATIDEHLTVLELRSELIDVSSGAASGHNVNYMGEWVIDNEYYINDLVDYEGEKYLCIESINESDENPATDTEHWTCLSDIGKVKIFSLTLTGSGNVLTSTEKLPGKHIHVMFEVETSGAHYGASCDLHPYNSSVCICYYNIAGEMQTAYIDEEGCVNLTIPNTITPTNLEAHYFEYK